ncbi:uncharacterized protein [Phyllobates terribilis]|uniref:uncharacterized protein isoform X2 n=1 Tax=Phyllobates terribilis TaxID=111132 RepID=UPI003CCB37C9
METTGKNPWEAEEVPMQVDSLQKRESNERREYRLRERLCFYYGQSDHFLINCPKCPRRPNKVLAVVEDYDNTDAESEVSETSLNLDAVFPPILMPTSPKDQGEKYSHCSLLIQIRWEGQWIPSSAMIDSGAGIPWLRSQNPNINWETKEISFLPKCSPTISPTVAAPVTQNLEEATQGLNMESSKIQVIIDWPVPGNIKEVQRFIGFANFYRRFIQNFLEVVRPITLLTKKGKKFAWSS